MEFRGPQQLLHPPSPPAVPETLSYGRQRPRGVRWRYAGLVALLAVCTLASWGVGRTAKAKTQAVLYESQVARHVEAAETVVYEPTAEGALALIEAGGHEGVHPEHAGGAGARLIDPQAYVAFRRALGVAASELGDRAEEIGAMVFLHELRTDAGVRRIVAVRFLPWAIDPKAGLPTAGLVAHVFEPGGWLGRPKWVATSRAPVLVPEPGPTPRANAFAAAWDDRFCDGEMRYGVLSDVFGPGGGIRWFAGQPDAFDASHFTLGFELVDGRRGTVDGYLSEDGATVHMKVRPDADPVAGGLAPQVTGVTYAN